MILTDREIQIALDEKQILIEPIPDEKHFSSTSVDLTLDAVLSEFKDVAPGHERTVDVGAEGYDHENVLRELTTP